jgi:hypothetical protein
MTMQRRLRWILRFAGEGATTGGTAAAALHLYTCMRAAPERHDDHDSGISPSIIAL